MLRNSLHGTIDVSPTEQEVPEAFEGKWVNKFRKETTWEHIRVQRCFIATYAVAQQNYFLSHSPVVFHINAQSPN